MAKIQSQAGTPQGCELSEEATVGDVKRFLVRLLQRVDRGRVSVKKGNCLAQIANVLINAIVDHELEARLDELERLKTAGRLSTPTSITIRAEASA